MGTFSLWHWLILIIWIAVPIVFVARSAPADGNRFGTLPHTKNFWQAIGSFFQNYVVFAGRASRSEFWYSYLFIFLVSILLLIIDPTEALYGLFTLAVALPTLAVSARRLHDINRSGWYQLLAYLFPIGTIALIIWYCSPPAEGFSHADQDTARQAARHTTPASLEVLERLAKLKDSGAITSEEYEVEKRKILS